MSMAAPGRVYLASDPKTSLSVSYSPGSASAPLIVFMNGLIKPASSFDACITQLLTLVAPLTKQPGILTWDRYGQGLSDKQSKKHDAMDVVKTLRELLAHVMGAQLDKKALILVCNSIGCPLARLYAGQHPKVQGLIFLDSMIAHSDFVSLFNPPEKIIAEECGALEQARGIVAKIFHPSVPNEEGFNRLHLDRAVPYSNRPALHGQPWVTVIGHDPVVFANDSEEKMKIPAWLITKYLDAEWVKYNHGLLQLTSPSRARGPIIATGADHFIQSARPDLVAQEIFEMLKKVLQ